MFKVPGCWRLLEKDLTCSSLLNYPTTIYLVLVKTNNFYWAKKPEYWENINEKINDMVQKWIYEYKAIISLSGCERASCRHKQTYRKHLLFHIMKKKEKAINDNDFLPHPTHPRPQAKFECLFWSALMQIMVQ